MHFCSFSIFFRNIAFQRSEGVRRRLPGSSDGSSPGGCTASCGNHPLNFSEKSEKKKRKNLLKAKMRDSDLGVKYSLHGKKYSKLEEKDKIAK